MNKDPMYWLGYILAKFKYPIMLFVAVCFWYAGMVEDSKPKPWQIVKKKDTVHVQKKNGEMVEVCLEYSIQDKQAVKKYMNWDLQSIPGHLYDLDEYLSDTGKSELKSNLNNSLSSDYRSGIGWNIRIDSVIYVKKQ